MPIPLAPTLRAIRAPGPFPAADFQEALDGNRDKYFRSLGPGARPLSDVLGRAADFYERGNNVFEQDQELWSGFASLTWNITDSFRLIGGGRYSDDDKDWENARTALTLNRSPWQASDRAGPAAGNEPAIP